MSGAPPARRESHSTMKHENRRWDRDEMARAASARRAGGLVLASLVTFAAAGCDAESHVDGFTKAEWAVISTLSPLPDVPDDPTNAYADDPAAATLGQKLFFEKRYSGPLLVGDDGTNGGLGEVGETGRVGCVTCHEPSTYFSDRRSNPNNVSLGVTHTDRNAPSLVNVAFYRWFGWAGKQDSLWTQASLSPESSTNSAGNRCAYAHVMWEHYRDEYDAVFPETPLPAALDPAAPDAHRFPASCKPKRSAADPDGAWEMMAEEDRAAINLILANCGKAVAAYERLLVSHHAPFDRYVAGDYGAISASAKRGLRLFIGRAACIACHSGPAFTDNDFHNVGVPQEGPNLVETDTGRYGDIASVLAHQFNTASEWSDDRALGESRLSGLVATDADLGAFRTKGLRGVAETAPYFHTGGVATLREVVELYDQGGAADGFEGTRDPRMVPLNLSEQDIDDLVAFLETLTGDPIPTALTVDTSAP